MKTTCIPGYLAILIFICIGCDPTAIKYSPAYSIDRSNTAPSLAIEISGMPSINYSGDVEPEFGKGDANRLIYAFFTRQLAKEIASQTVLKNISYDTVANQAMLSQEALDIPGRSDIIFRIPQKGSRFAFRNSEPDFALFLDDIVISSHFEMHVSDAGGHYSIDTAGQVLQVCMAGASDWAEKPFRQYIPAPMPFFYHSAPSFSSSKDLVVEATFILWDNKQADLVSYGLVQAVDKNQFAVSMEDWLSVMREFTEKMFEESPFVR